MKNVTLLFSATLLAYGASAQSTEQAASTSRTGFGVNQGWYPTSGETTITSGDELWLRDETWTTDDGNITLQSGNSSISVGYDDPNVRFTIAHDLTGRISSRYLAGNNNANSGNVFIYSLDDVGVTGSTVDRTSWSANKPDNAVTVFHQDFRTDRNMGSYTFYEGNYQGGNNMHGVHMHLFNSFSSYGASFVAGEHDGNRFSQSSTRGQGMVVRPSGQITTPDGDTNNFTKNSGVGVVDNRLNDNIASGAWLYLGTGDILISNRTGVATDRFEGSTIGDISEIGESGKYGQVYYLQGGDGLTADTMGGSAKIHGGDFIGSKQADGSSRSLNYNGFDMRNVWLDASGGRGAFFKDITQGVDIEDGNFIGGEAGEAHSAGDDSQAVSVGGHGVLISGGGVNSISGGNYSGGQTKAASVASVGRYILTNNYSFGTLPASSDNSKAFANGAHGIYLDDTGNTTVSGVTAIGSSGSSATANGSNSYANASGGNGLFSDSTDVTINSGTFIGANGGTATSDGLAAEAYGGAGVYATDGNLTINGGYFEGGASGRANGQLQSGNIGVMVRNGNLAISDSSTNTLIVGDVVFANASAQDLDITGGEIGGDIYKSGAGLATLRVSTNAIYSGSYVQMEGDSLVDLSNSEESKFFTDVVITDGDMTFDGAQVRLADQSRFSIGGQSNTLDFGASGVVLGAGSSINAGQNFVVSGADLELGENSSITFGFDSLTGLGGSVTAAGALIATNTGAKIRAEGVSATPMGEFQVAEAASVVLGSNTLTDVVDVDFGWLTQLSGAQITNGIRVAYEYNSLTNSSLADLGENVLTNVDTIIVGLDTNEFYALNSGGGEDGTKMLRHTLSQLPDSSEAAFQVSQKVNEQIAARGTEFRSMNGFASTKPKFASPMGAAGPKNKSDAERTMQGWVRAYGAFGERDADGKFASYETTSWGTVVGLDKSFGNVLVGLAGGYSRSDLDAGTAYEADVDTYHGSLYTTFGGERLFVDLAATYGLAKTEESNASTKGDFNSDLMSLYAGMGYAFAMTEKFSLTPEASFLASYYKQEEYTRSGSLGGTIQEYDTTSYLGTLGVNLATRHQIDWLNRGLAYIPEVRAHWLHDFNADPDSFNYVIGGTVTPFAVRPRDEDLLRLGVGFDIWNWKYQNTKFEVDYDGLFSGTYREHVFSGKVTWRF